MQNDHSIQLRDMALGEEKMLLNEARQAFSHSPLEQIAISKPKFALVAMVDGALGGAMFLRVFDGGGQKIGYLDVGFVKKEFRGQGIAHVLYPAAIARLWEMGCGHIAAQVIDDNAASWKPLKSQGFGTPSLTELTQLLGLCRAVSLWLRTLFCVACGAQLWMSGPVKERRSAQELLSFLGVNLLLFLPGLIRLAAQPDSLARSLLAYPVVLLVGVAFGGIGCFAAGGSWRFSFPRGGLLLTLVLNTLGSVFPMVGRWYLKEPQATKDSRRAMGEQAAIEWVGIMALFSVGAFLLKDNAFLHRCATLAANLLVYRLFPFMSFGGGRVWRWNKLAFIFLAATTIALIAFVP